jgi:hypothetical protein
MAIQQLPFLPVPMPHSPARRAPRGWLAAVRRHAVILLFLAVAGWVLGVATSPQALLALGLGWLVAVLLGAHRTQGWRGLARAVAEFTVVATLAVLSTMALAPHSPTTATPEPGGPPMQAQAAPGFGQGCPPVKQARAWAACLLGQGRAEAARRAPTGGGR